MPQASIQLTILLHLNQLHMSASNKASPVHHTLGYQTWQNSTGYDKLSTAPSRFCRPNIQWTN